MPKRSLVPALRRIYLLLALLALLQPAVHARLLPNRVAAWFGLDGSPLLWTTRPWLLGTMSGIVLALALATIIGLRAWCGRHDDADRAEACQRLGLWFGLVTTGFVVCVFQLVLEANARLIPQLPMGTLGWLAGSYVAFAAVWAWLARR